MVWVKGIEVLSLLLMNCSETQVSKAGKYSAYLEDTMGSTPQGGEKLNFFLEIFSNYDPKAHAIAVAMPKFQTFSIIRTPTTIQNIDASNGSF